MIPFEVTAQETANCPEQRKTTTYTTQKLFFDESGSGTMAMMPNVKSQREAKSEHKFKAFLPEGTYELGGKIRDIWFVHNHRTGSGDTPKSYIAVLIAKVLKTKLQTKLELYRNKDWFNLKSGSKLGVFSELFPSVEDFTKFHKDSSVSLEQSKSSLEQSKRKFSNWHALASKKPKLTSWDLRKEWGNYKLGDNLNCFKELLSDDKIPENHIFVQARLIRFSLTEKSEPDKPVAWVVKLSDARAVYIKTFSPNINFRGEYYIHLLH